MGAISVTKLPNISGGNGGILSNNLQLGRAIVILSQVWEWPRYQANKHANVNLEPIPLTVVQSILKNIGEETKDGFLEHETVAGAYKVGSGEGAGIAIDDNFF